METGEDINLPEGQGEKEKRMEKENEEQKRYFFYKKEKVFKKYACSCATPQLKAR